jgi:hypothetical protein
MRTPGRKRPMVRKIVGERDSAADREALAEAVSYVGSPEHKDVPSFAGHPPRPRPDASICDRSLAQERDMITGWLRKAVRSGAYGEYRENGFPRYIWYKDGGVVYEGRLVNAGQGTYKGYPLDPSEWPRDIERFYG